MYEIVSIDTPTLGDRSYLVHDGSTALVVDPQRDIDRVLELAQQRGVRITHVFETHIHNDYVTGGFALAQVTGAAYHVNSDDPVAFERVGVTDGDVVDVSPSLRLRVIATPGHTFTHLSYALEAGGEVVAAFTGGSLLFGSTGRPDLLGPGNAVSLARHQHASARRLAGELPEAAGVFPTHGFGSFCSAAQTEGTESTIGAEKYRNPALLVSEDDYVEAVFAGLGPWPAYYAHMGPANSAGPAAPDLSPASPADAAELRRRIAAGEWVVDLRNRTAFSSGHLAGSLNFGLDGSFATYLGWMIPWGTPVTLVGETAAQVAEAQRELVRIGIDRPAAAASGSPQDWSGGEALGTHRRAGFADLAGLTGREHIVVLDVRRQLEWEEGHLAGALHIPLHDLLARLDDVPAGEVWVHCRSGYRASIAASVLARAGRAVVSVDDDFANAVNAGLDLVRAQGVAA